MKLYLMESNWSNKYILNIDEIDKQHKGFFELFDKEIENVDEKKLKYVIEKLESYIKYHFSYEEELLLKSGYKDIDNHKLEHKFFIQKVEEMKQDVIYKNNILSQKLLDFMKKWFLGHILYSDHKYKDVVVEYLKANNSI